MALTGLQIQKLLPQTNCKECGSNTCLAFAMKLAAKKAELAECPYVSEEARRVLGEASEPPIRTVALGPDRRLLIGGETVLYRHEKTFFHPTLLAVNVDDADAPEALGATLARIRDYTFTRVGETFGVDLVSVTQRAPEADRFLDLAERAWRETGRPLVLRSPDPAALAAAASRVRGSRSVLCCPGPEAAAPLLAAAASRVRGSRSVLCCPGPAAAAPLLAAAREHDHALALAAPDMDALLALAQTLRDGGFLDLLLTLPAADPSARIQLNTIVRRAALKEAFRPAGHPLLCALPHGDPLETTAAAATEILKYGGICVLPEFDPAQLATLFTLRQNIYTDPQKPIQVEPKLYPLGDPTPDAPVFVTTNFSLTYFVVSGEIENSGISAWLAVPECEGMSVLTAWAAGKFNAATIARFFAENRIEDEVRSRTLVIPGYVAQISGELEDALPGWKILVGPQEAADIEGFVRSVLARPV
jgi:acetyl-CoA decarbonylase/synthase complex subunit gamma